MAKADQGVRRGSLPAHTARRIIRDFADRGVVPGEGLADEATLIERYGVSRGTLREALRLLQFLGAITIKAGPQGGARLATPDPAVVGSALGMVVQFHGATLRTVFETRLAVEPAVAALAATNRTEEDLVRLDELVAALHASRGRRGPSYAQHAARYSLSVAQASQNALLAALVPALVAMNTTVAWRYPEGSRSELADRVEIVVKAIRGGDSVAASAATYEMISGLMAELEDSQSRKMDSRILWPDVDEVLEDRFRN
jgi:GntR family transcriptional repressor for pyruvate dehydrogenase complex